MEKAGESYQGVAAQNFRVARFFMVQQTKSGKNIPNNHKIFDMYTKYTK
jgi:hypothetical protein